MKHEILFMKHVILFVKFFSFILCASCYTLYATSINAQQITLSLSPSLIETIIKPGKAILIAYNLKNLGDPTVVKAKVLPFIPKDNYGNITIKDEFEGPVRFSLDNSLIKLDEPFTLKSGENQQLLLRIRLPEGAPVGDYYYTLLVETQPAPELGGSTASTARASVGANIIITVTDTGILDTKGRISFFDVLTKVKFFGRTMRIFDSNDKIPVALVILNQGKNVVKPKGEIVLRGNFGEKATYDILPQNILAESQRLILATPSAGLEKQPVSLVLKGFFVGRYSLLANVGFTEEGPATVFSSTAFFAFPFKIGLAILAAVLIGVIIIRRVKET